MASHHPSIVRAHRLLAAALAAVLLAACAPKPDMTKPASPALWPRAAYDGVRITYVANSGFIIEAGGRKVLIDALPGDGLLSPEVRDKAGLALPPFDNADLVLITHKHTDHFDAGLTRKYMSNNPRAVLASTSQVTAVLTGLGDRIITIAPGPGASEVRELGGCHVEAFPFPHDGGRAADLGFLVEVGGKRFFHTGDVDIPPLDLDAFSSYGLAKRGIDFLFIVHFYLDDDPASQRFLAELAGGARIIPTHYVGGTPPFDPVKIRRQHPDAKLFSEKLESWVVQ